jgi:hypothetical protein
VRVLGWVLVVVGVLVAAGSPVYVESERDRYEAIAKLSSRPAIWWEKKEALTPWPGVALGAGVAAFGVLLLAIRRPTPPGAPSPPPGS